MTVFILEKLKSIQFLKTEILLDTKKAKAYGHVQHLTWAIGHVTPLREMLHPRVTFEIGGKIERITMRSHTEERKAGDAYDEQICILKLIFGKRLGKPKLLSNLQKFDPETKKKFQTMVELLRDDITYHLELAMRNEKYIASGEKARKFVMQKLVEEKLRPILREAAKAFYNDGEILELFHEEKNLATIENVMEN